MTSSLVLVIVVAVAYVAAQVAFEWLGRRFLVVSGAEYLLLGILLGPEVSGLLTPGVVERFAPVTTLALGWMGALVGVRLYLAELVKVPGLVYRVALLESALTFVVVAAVETLALGLVYDIAFSDAMLPAAALAGIATASSSAGVELVARRFNERGVEVTQLAITVLVNAIVAVVSFGLLASVWHAPVMIEGRPLTPTEWMAITLGIGVVSGVLFHLFVGEETNTDRLFISLAGGIILVSGAASHAGLSPLLSALVFGAILVNTSRNRAEIVAAIARVERPMYFVLLVFAGAAWQPSARAWVLPVVLFVAVRALAKLGGTRLVTRANGLLPVLGPDWGRALLGQGGLALAIALNYVYQDGGTLPYFVFTAAIVSVLLTDLISARLVHSVIGPMIVRRRAAAPAAPDAAGD
jgi:hypothetical protein